MVELNDSIGDLEIAVFEKHPVHLFAEMISMI